MKQKKFPVMWVVAMVIGLTMVFILNVTGGQLNFASLLTPRQEAPEGPAASKDETSSALKTQVASLTDRTGGDDPAEMGRAPEMQQGLPPEPAILIKQRERQVQAPNESATSGQWYKEGSYVKDQSEEVRDNRTIDTP